MTTFTSVQAGLWTSGETWGNGAGGDYPGKTTSGDVINVNHHVTYNIDNQSGGSLQKLGHIDMTNGSLGIATNMSTYMWIGDATSPSIDVDYNNRFYCGTSGVPLGSQYNCVIEVDRPTVGVGVFCDNTNNGTIALYGAIKTVKGLTTSALTSGTSTFFTMSSVPTNWLSGDELIVQATSGVRLENEILPYIGLSGGSVAYFGGNPQFDHKTSALVLNITRNIKIFGTSGAHSDDGFTGGNSTFQLYNIRLQNLAANDTSSANLHIMNAGDNRKMEIVGCTIMEALGHGMYQSGANAHALIKDTIFWNNGRAGVEAVNQIGEWKYEKCYFVQNGTDGCAPDNRGQAFFKHCYFWSNGEDGLDSEGMAFTSIGCYFFLNLDYGYECTYGHHQMISNIFGESHAGTQPNTDADIFIDRTKVEAHDCKFSSVDEWDASNSYGNFFQKSNYQQTANNLEIDGQSGTGSKIEDDTVVFRTSSPSVKLIPTDSDMYVRYKMPIQQTSGDTVTVTIYGKASSSSGWERNPRAYFIGCGIDDETQWSVSDTNWNSIQVSGTSSRDGIVVLIIEVADTSNTFNVDDITVAIT